MSERGYEDLKARVSWRDLAACRDHFDVFWPNGDAPSTLPELAAARAVCACCPVKEPCLDDALSQSPRPAGVWAGTTMADRRMMARRRKPKFCVRCGDEMFGIASQRYCSHSCQQADWMRRNRRSA